MSSYINQIPYKRHPHFRPKIEALLNNSVSCIVRSYCELLTTYSYRLSYLQQIRWKWGDGTFTQHTQNYSALVTVNMYNTKYYICIVCMSLLFFGTGMFVDHSMLAWVSVGGSYTRQVLCWRRWSTGTWFRFVGGCSRFRFFPLLSLIRLQWGGHVGPLLRVGPSVVPQHGFSVLCKRHLRGRGKGEGQNLSVLASDVHWWMSGVACVV